MHRSSCQQSISALYRHTFIMSGMPAQQGHSAACCNIPPVVSKGYSAKGSYEEFGGYKSCKFHLPSENKVHKQTDLD